jgi:hypothetical protein
MIPNIPKKISDFISNRYDVMKAYQMYDYVHDFYILQVEDKIGWRSNNINCLKINKLVYLLAKFGIRS